MSKWSVTRPGAAAVKAAVGLNAPGLDLTPSDGIGIYSSMYGTPSILRLSVHREAKPELPSALSPLPDPPVAECLAFIRRCRDSLVPLLDRAAGVTAKELRILKDLRSEGGDCAAVVARRLGIDDGEMSRLVRRLVEKDLIGKTGAKARGRTALHLTPTGRALVDRTSCAEHMLMEARLEELSPGELESLRRAMAVVTELLCGVPRRPTNGSAIDLSNAPKLRQT